MEASSSRALVRRGRMRTAGRVSRRKVPKGVKRSRRRVEPPHAASGTRGAGGIGAGAVRAPSSMGCVVEKVGLAVGQEVSRSESPLGVLGSLAAKGALLAAKGNRALLSRHLGCLLYTSDAADE